MLAYYGYTISPNQIETREGFLICRNVPIARTGDQEYLGRELGLSGADAEKVVIVHRPPEEVFSEAALASFEGKPTTDDHPPELLTPDTVSMYEKGHAQNIRKGTDEWEGYVIADLHIHDRSLIDAIQQAQRECFGRFRSILPKEYKRESHCGRKPGKSREAGRNFRFRYIKKRTG